jgi:hypothetical protein
MTSPTIHFDEENHIYIVNGEVKRSVTQILKDAGIINYDGVSEYYRDRGTAIHKGCELLAQGWLDWDTVHPDYEPYLRRFEKMIEGFEYVDSEVPVYHSGMDYCGTYDLSLKRGGLRYLCEIKTSKSPADWWGLQVAAYDHALYWKADGILLFSLGNDSVYAAKDRFIRNTATWIDIFNNTFNLSEWKKDRNRRYMVKV